MGVVTAAPAGAATFVNVAPRTGLVDLQHVTVAGRGFTANSQVGTVECKPGALAENDCDLGTLVYHRVDANGKFSFQRYVRRIITVASKKVDCAGSQGCILGAGNISNLKQSGGRTIFFDPKVPPKVAKIAVSPRTGLADHQLVTVSGTGFAPSQTVYIEECMSAASPKTPIGLCDYATQRYVKTTSHGAFTAANFPVERRQTVFDGKTTKRLDCAHAPGRCQIRVLASGYGTTSSPPAVSLNFNPKLPPAVETVQLSASTQLVDLQPVTVTGAGFTPGYGVTVLECAVTADALAPACDYNSQDLVTADFQGGFTTTVWVRRKISAPTATSVATVDCAAKAGACELLFQGSPSQPNATAVLGFDPSVPAVAASVSASPNTGLANNQRVNVTIGGFTPDHTVQLLECGSEAATRADLSYCDYATGIVTTPGGPTGSATFVVRTTIRVPDGLENCKSAAGACVLVAIGGGAYYGGGYAAQPFQTLASVPNAASTPLTFAP